MKNNEGYKVKKGFTIYFFFAAIICLIGSIVLFVMPFWWIGIPMILLSIIFAILSFVFFAKLTNIYPLNDISQYRFNKSCLIPIKESSYEIKIIKADNGKWETENNELIFDMTGYLFPRTYICSYFIRQFSYSIINQKKLTLKHLFSSLKVNEKYNDICIIFEDSKKQKCFKIIKNGKTKTMFFRGIINQTPYYAEMLNRLSGVFQKYRYIDEDIYSEKKRR